jgi:hypothetical protein
MIESMMEQMEEKESMGKKYHEDEIHDALKTLQKAEDIKADAKLMEQVAKVHAKHASAIKKAKPRSPKSIEELKSMAAKVK